VSRDGKERTFEVTLDALNADESGAPSVAEAETLKSNALGLAVQDLGNEQRRSLGNPEGGVIITKVESESAYRAGLRAGDVILMLNNTAVEDVEAFNEIVTKVKPGKAVALRILRDGVSNFIAYTPSIEE
jgi:serine protease Do